MVILAGIDMMKPASQPIAGGNHHETTSIRIAIRFIDFFGLQYVDGSTGGYVYA